MTRSIYENEDDFKNEQEMADMLAEKWKCKMLRQKKLSQFDFIAYRNAKPLAFLEFRKRKQKFNDFPTMIVSMTKLVAWHSSKAITGLPCYFVVQWADAVGYTDLENFVIYGELKISAKTNNRRNAYDDQEIISLLSTDHFKML
jgi:hypothetical protein